MGYRRYYEQQTGIAVSQERQRLCDPKLVTTWRRWGPYLSERQWGTVREWYDSSGGKNPWTDLVHDHARSRTYRWGEDGLLGISDQQQLLCFALALWNESDPILKERLFGLTNPEGNHGEDVKEYYFYLDNTPTHSFMRGLYNYPYSYPYGDLVDNSHKIDPLEYELMDTGALANSSYFDVLAEYAKNTPEDIVIRITATNRGTQTRTLHVLPTLWFRNTWSWGDPEGRKPALSRGDTGAEYVSIYVSDVTEYDTLSKQEYVRLTRRALYCADKPELLFAENETNLERFGWGTNRVPWPKDGINDYIVSHGTARTVNPNGTGTKAAAHYSLRLPPGGSATLRLRLTDQSNPSPFAAQFDQIFTEREQEMDEFYASLSPYSVATDDLGKDYYRVQRQAFAGMLWSKQFFHLVPYRWLRGDAVPPSLDHQNDAKLQPWQHMYCKDVLSMPDKWEYPWFASWDLAFHTTTLAIIDPSFAKYQIDLLVMEYYQHPNGALPAYEWDFSNINPPVHAWAALKVFRTEQEIYGHTDWKFLERVFEKLNMNFTWWVNRVDEEGNNVFGGGFLGLDNIRILDRDPAGNPIEQADGTAWMALFALTMLEIAVTLGDQPTVSNRDAAVKYRDAARKYLQHFMFICNAMNSLGQTGLWDETEGFFMDCARNYGRLRVFSIVGLVPLFAVARIRQTVTDPYSYFGLSGFLRWFARHRHDLLQENAVINLDELITQVSQPRPTELDGTVGIVNKEKLTRILARALDPGQFLSPHGVRGLSKVHLDQQEVRLPKSDPLHVAYECAESITMKRMGGNSNWCGPVWMPVNYLFVESLRKYHRQLGTSFQIAHPTGAGGRKTLAEVADDLARRLIGIFARDPVTGKRPVFWGNDVFQNDPHWKDNILFYEYFHGGDRYDRYAGAGLGASHQTGWTGLVANLIQELGVRERAAAMGIPED